MVGSENARGRSRAAVLGARARCSHREDRIVEGRLVFIAGSGRSGSTLLDLLLNNSPQVQSVGEVHRLNWYARTNREPCTCGQPVMECPFWLRVQAQAQQILGVSEDEPLLKTKDMLLWPADVGRLAGLLQKAALVVGHRGLYKWVARRFCKAHYQATENALFWYDMIRRVTGCPVIVDSTKDARRLKVLYLTDPEHFKLIYMVRDGRAVAASAMRREDKDMATAARIWVDANRRSLWAQRGIPAEKHLRVNYETLCREPKPTMQRVCAFVGVPFDEDMVVLRKQESHNIGGNPMRFRQGEATIRLDEQWREELSPEDLSVFERVAGRWNRRLGYAD